MCNPVTTITKRDTHDAGLVVAAGAEAGRVVVPALPELGEPAGRLRSKNKDQN